MLFKVYKEIINQAQSVVEARSDQLESIINDFIEDSVSEYRESITQLAANHNFTDEDIDIIIAGSRTSDEYKDRTDIEDHEIRNVMTSSFCQY
tara:strand:+ start:60 stop:338 length:279 start_codon:yes stop_codon:yes gene_type:complete